LFFRINGLEHKVIIDLGSSSEFNQGLEAHFLKTVSS